LTTSIHSRESRPVADDVVLVDCAERERARPDRGEDRRTFRILFDARPRRAGLRLSITLDEFSLDMFQKARDPRKRVQMATPDHRKL
jgi:hypothetical protein